MKVRVKVRPSGLINGVEWPHVGETIDLPDVVADGMITAGDVEPAKAASSDAAPAKKAAPEPRKRAPKPKVETRPASTEGVETRKKS